MKAPNKTSWKKGESGNPRGRGKGLSTGEALRRLIFDDGVEIIQMMIDKAKQGDTFAAKVLIDRMVPVLKPVTEPVVFTVASNDKLPDIGQAVLDMLSRGELSPDGCNQILGALSTQAKIVESQELAERISALESKVGE